jgi:vitamin B12 transporter
MFKVPANWQSLQNARSSWKSQAILYAAVSGALLLHAAGISLAAAETGNAQTEADDQIMEITVEAPRPDWESELSPGTVTVIRPEDYQGEQKTLPELLKDVPGVHVRYVSGKGGYTTVSVRGSTAAQVGVFADGVLVNLGGDAAVDLSTIPVKNIERIEVYRGYIPARFGGTYMGGVINIVTKKPQQSEISSSAAGASSYGGVKANIEVSAPLGGGSLLAGFNHDQSKGDFPYTNPGVAMAQANALTTYETQMATIINAVNMTFIDLCHFYSGPAFTSIDDIFAAESEIKQNIYQSYINNGEDEATATAKAESVWNSNFYTHYLANKASLNDPALKSSTRYRRNNDYQNSDALIKWQDGHWTLKGTYKHIERGLPKELPLTGDLWTDYYINRELRANSVDRKRQEIISVDLLAGRRECSGNLEWGWNLNYLDLDKHYRNLDYHDSVVRPMAEWSEFDSRRWGGALDGAYKAGKNHMLEFLVNGSFEAMDVDGSGMDRYDMSDELPNALRFRTYFEQVLCNIQLQDTITLNRSGDCWFTPGIRYNFSEVMGRAAGPDRKAIDENHRWVKQEDRQTNARATWQLALKKQMNRQLTLQSTYGTYYQLLNLYEIAGDGAGILPRPNTDDDGNLTGSMFPAPEEGTQWDLAAVWDGNLLGSAASNIQLTYFGRKSENLLQLYRFGYDYWSYTNSAKGQVQGLEFQAGGNWKKWDLNLSGTWMWERQAWARNPTPVSAAQGADYYMEQFYTYTPEWEGALRLTYRPGAKIAIFSELKYEGEMFCWADQNEGDGIRVLEALTTVGLGAKYQFRKDFQAVAGVNDLFDQGPDRRVRAKFTGDTGTSYVYFLSDYLLQGRTYYLTLQYKY